MKKIKYLLINVIVVVLLLAGGCGGVVTRSSPEIKTFFLAGQEARLTGMEKTLRQERVDLTAYAHLMEVKYPPTSKVEVLQGPPVQGYVVFAVLQGPKPPDVPSDDSKIIEGLKTKAQAIGADAIIICQDPHGAENNLEVLAVKYRLE